MLKVKKIFSAFVGMAMAANALVTMPISAFADDETNRTYTYDDYEITYGVTDSWANTEIVSVTLSNTGDSPIENWMLYFEPNGQVHNTVNVEEKQTSGGKSYFKNKGYNATVNPDSSVSFSYMVNDCQAPPDEFKLCQKRAEKESGYQVSLTVNQDWGSEFIGSIVIENNTDEAIEAWELTIDTNFTITEITNSWAASVTELEPYNYMLKGTYTGTVQANSSVTLGFNGIKSGDPEITNYSLTEVVVDEEIINGFNWDNWDNWEDMEDSDGDGIPDIIEKEIGTDPMKSDTDGDGLPDGYEFFTIGSDPANANSLDESVSDGAFDSDQDGLSNYEEYQLGTDPNRTDSDYDDLSDGEEVNTYGTDPLNPDTDGDGLTDGDEIALGLNPLVADSDGDGIPDNEEKFSQSKTFDTEESDTVIDSVNVSFEGTGNIDSTTTVESIMDKDWMCSNIVGLVGEPYDITSESSFETAEITFTVDKSSLGSNQFDNLIILWYNEEEQRFVEMETIANAEASTLTAVVEHFSKYLIVNKTEWYKAWSKNNYPSNGKKLHTAITVDWSGSMLDRYEEANKAKDSFVGTMKYGDMASIIYFTENAYEMQELTSNKDKLKKPIDDLKIGAGTDFIAALDCSLKSLEKHHSSNAEDIIIFISDGHHTGKNNSGGNDVSKDDFDFSLVDEAAEKGIRIYTIGLFEGVNDEILKEMARRTNGEYYYANTAKEMTKHFLNVNMSEKYDTVTDSDVDGIPDLFEIYGMPVANGRVLFSNPNEPDTDGDHLKDSEEVIMHVVNSAEEVEKAYKYVSEFIPEVFISDNGGIYFTIRSFPDNKDSDQDKDRDDVDPNPMVDQLNGYFAQQMGKLQGAANEYLKINNYEPSSTDEYRGMKDIWLCFMFLRNFNNDYRSDCDSRQCWKCTGGNIDNSFVEYVANSYSELYFYFSNFDEDSLSHNYVYTDPVWISKNHIDLYHLSATMTALLYETSATDKYEYYMADGFHSSSKFSYLDGLAGIFGDGSQLINDLKGQSLITGSVSVSDNKSEYIKTEEYENNYNVIKNNIGTRLNSGAFSPEDLLSDIDVVNLYNGYIKKGNVDLENVINLYYATISTRYTQFKNNFLISPRTNLYNTCYEHTWCYIWAIYKDIYGNPLLNKDEDEGYVIAFSQALTDLIEDNISKEKKVNKSK